MNYEKLSKQDLLIEFQKLRDKNNKLKERLNGLDNLFNATTIGLYKTNINGDILEANQPLVEMLGYLSLDDMKSFNVVKDELVNQKEREKFIKVLDKDEVIIGLETVWRKKDGNKIYIRESSRAIKNEKGEILYFEGTVENISDKKQKEHELIESERKYRTLIELLPNGFVIHKNSKIVYVNNAISKTLKVKNKEELIGRNIYDFIHPSFHNAVQNRIEETILYNKNVETREELIIADNNEFLNIEVSSFSIEMDGEQHVVTITKNITEQKKAEQELRQSELTYRNMLNSISEAIFVQDFEGKFIDVNKAAESLFGLTHNEFIDKYPKDISEDGLNNNDAILLKIKKAYDGKNQNLRFWGKNKNGKSFISEVSLSSGVYFDKKVVIAVVRDISERYKIEGQLKQSEKKYRELINFAVGGILIGSPEGIILEANDYMCSLFGKPKTQIIGKNINQGFFTEESIQKAPLNYDKLKTGQVLINQRDIIKSDGSVIPIEMHTKMMPDKTYQSIYHDISERKVAEQKLLEAKNKADSLSLHREALLKAIPDIIISINKNGNIVEFYSNYKKPYVVKTEDFIDRDVEEVFTEDLAFFFKSNVNKVIKNKKIETFTYSYDYLPEQRKVYLDTRLVYLNENTALLVIRDITERMKLIYDLEVAKQRAEESERLKTAFLANMSHEVRTPMNAIIGFADLLKCDIEENEKLDYINIIQNSCYQLLNVLDDIIELSKIESGAVLKNVTSFNLNELLDEIYLSWHNNMLKNPNVKLIFNKTTSSNLLCVSDKIKIKQIFTNLISNALKYTEKGQVEFGFKEISAGEIEFYVSDTGLGISQENIKKIFDRFTQIDNKLTNKTRGSGIGLSICKAYSELLGGKITVKSEQNKGSTFYFTFPKFTFA
ncbi:MAG: PAS domain S-box protein [Bacteroidales bacterium]|nr:PAS domain S-box protein [Bacteroidales bacterium]MCK9499568.1 PAS domain S-box protein [Bacteroidales bacterium]MDY0315524.1 PAS domain S-box protein [Bacteroidales bacterium]NLB86249.1 PAS domain S-box protein [Bacteroidales bacterium]